MKNPIEAIVEIASRRKSEAAPTPDREFSQIIYMRDVRSKDYLIVNREEIKRAAKHTMYPGPVLITMQIGTFISPDSGNAWKIKTIVNYLPPSKRAGRAVTVFWLEEA